MLPGPAVLVSGSRSRSPAALGSAERYDDSCIGKSAPTPETATVGGARDSEAAPDAVDRRPSLGFPALSDPTPLLTVSLTPRYTLASFPVLTHPCTLFRKPLPDTNRNKMRPVRGSSTWSEVARSSRPVCRGADFRPTFPPVSNVVAFSLIALLAADDDDGKAKLEPFYVAGLASMLLAGCFA